MDKIVIEAAGLKKKFDRKEILDGVSFSVREGETVALIGSSGAGKTTIFNLLTGTIAADEGIVKLYGKDIMSYDNRSRAHVIGLMRQQFDLVEQLSVLNNVLAGNLSRWSFFKSLCSLIHPADRTQAEKVLERVGLADKVYERTADLSGGEQQRVALARLLIQAPDILLADEPIASLDPALADSVLSMLVNLTREDHITLVCTLHSVDYAMKYFKRVIGLKDGRVWMDKPPHEITESELETLYKSEDMTYDSL